MIAHRPFGRTGLVVPPIVFGATNLGNLFRAIDDVTKAEIVRNWIKSVPAPCVIDSAGKYGAGLSLEVIGRELNSLGVSEDDVIISNKLAWRRVPLSGPEPTFEPGAWIGIEHDAVQDISYQGILRCWEEGNQLLGKYRASLISVHDPDEYLAAAKNEDDRKRRLQDIVEAYRALIELRDTGHAQGVGIGAKNWTVIQELDAYCQFDWVMFANSLTIMHHPPELVDFVQRLSERRVGIINSALFHGGFLVGGDFFNYRPLAHGSLEDQGRLAWREAFWDVCKKYQQQPFDVAVAFGRSHPGITSIALSSSRPDRIQSHVDSSIHQVPSELWHELKNRQLIDSSYRFV